MQVIQIIPMGDVDPCSFRIEGLNYSIAMIIGKDLVDNIWFVEFAVGMFANIKVLDYELLHAWS